MRRVRRDDQVLVISGKERGKQGQVREVFVKQERVIVSGLNMVKRHKKSTDQRTPAGIIDKEAPIHMSNVKLICPSCQKPSRVGFRMAADGTKMRVCRACSEDIV